jgi:asparagine N-glycosylation enzyme membrane subunit Stt3
LPTIRTSGDALARAVGAALLAGLLVAALWYVLPDWKFYLSLALGFGVAESMARVVKGKRGTDLQAAAIIVVTISALVARVLLAWKYGIGVDEVSSGERILVFDGDTAMAGTAADFLQLHVVPDLLFLALSYAIVWVRFR